MADADSYWAHEHVTVIEPPAGWRLLDWRELWAFRELLWVLTTRGVKVRYKQTVLGVAWAIIQPLFTMAVFTVFFGNLGKIPSDGRPYALFILVALIPWQLFAYALTQSSMASSPASIVRMPI